MQFDESNANPKHSSYLHLRFYGNFQHDFKLVLLKVMWKIQI